MKNKSSNNKITQSICTKMEPTVINIIDNETDNNETGDNNKRLKETEYVTKEE